MRGAMEAEEKEVERAQCSRCQEELLPAERYCSSCGQDNRWTPRPQRVFRRIPRGLDVSHFQTAADRAATRALAMAAPVQAAVRYYLRRVAEPEYRNQLLANAVRVSATQSPRIHYLARTCEAILDTAPVEVYVYNSPEATAFSFGSGETDVIVITSTLADFVPDDDELLYLLGCQLGHVKADHVVYLTVAKALGTALRGIPALGSALSGAANFLLVPWERTATLTADRAGLLCSQNLVASARAMAKMQLGLGATVSKLRMDEFLDQARDLEREGDWGDTWKKRPALARRIRLLEEYYDSPLWAQVFEGSWDPLAPHFPCFYCAGGGSPSSLHFPLSHLACRACGRNLMIEELPCPTCNAPLPVKEGASLEDLDCPRCEAPYLDRELRDRYRTEYTPEHLGGSHYQTLGVSTSATPAALRRSFRERVEALENRVAGLGRGDPVSQKIGLYAAFKTLIDPQKRRRHNRLLEYRRVLRRELEGLEELPSCTSCGAPLRGSHCALCGWSELPAGEETPGALAGKLRELLGQLARGDQGELLEENQGTFDFAFHRRREAYFFACCPSLDRPGTIRRLIRAADEVEVSSRPGTHNHFYALVEGSLDLALVARLLESARGDGPRVTEKTHREISLRLLRPAPSGLEVLTPGDDGLTSRSHEDLERWLRRELEVSEGPE